MNKEEFFANDNDVYLFLVDDVFTELREEKPKTSDEAYKIIEKIRYKIESRIDTALDDIFDDYCEENNLKWENEN